MTWKVILMPVTDLPLPDNLGIPYRPSFCPTDWLAGLRHANANQLDGTAYGEAAIQTIHNNTGNAPNHLETAKGIRFVGKDVRYAYPYSHDGLDQCLARHLENVLSIYMPTTYLDRPLRKVPGPAIPFLEYFVVRETSERDSS